MAERRYEFKGFPRPDGRVGVRNLVAVIPSVVCASHVARRIADSVREAVYIDNQFGCSQLKPDLEITFRTLAGIGRNPNIASVLIVSLGCEELPAEKLADEIARSGKSVELIVIREVGGSLHALEKGVRILRRLAEEASRVRRESFDLSAMVLGVECGGSDATSGIAANPVTGYVADKVVDMGGAVVLSETPEMIGAEELLIKRVRSPEVAEKLVRAIRKWIELAHSVGVDLLGTQPTRGNIEGGITTIEEKSLGAIIKGGSRTIQDVLEYAEEVQGRGLFVMDTPGNDVISLAGMAAGGVQLTIFTTGRGTPVGNPVMPVIKVTGNPYTYEKMSDDIDFDASSVITNGRSVEEVGEELLQLVLEVASGKPTRAELGDHTEFVIHKILPSL